MKGSIFDYWKQSNKITFLYYFRMLNYNQLTMILQWYQAMWSPKIYSW